MVKFAERMDDVKASDIRELLALINRPEIISFAGGLPAPELFPVDKIKAATDAVLDENGRAALQYGPTDGLLRLREQIADRLLAKNSINTDPDHIIMTAGSQQGLDFAARRKDDLRHPRLPEPERTHMAHRAPQKVYGDRQQV